MTRILICSDLHTNFHKDGGESVIKGLNTDADIVVIAGDLSIVVNNLLQDNIKMFCDRYSEVVFVAGNHEYYHSTFLYLETILGNLDASISNFTWLDNTRIKVLGVPFIGATLWFPRSTPALSYKDYLNDFNCIFDCDPIAFDKHEETVDFFDKNIQKGDVVVSHHMPTFKCVNHKYKNSKLNCYFACSLDKIIESKRPKIWCLGHTHSNVDLMVEKTRLIGNPLGYPGENNFFRNDLVIKV